MGGRLFERAMTTTITAVRKLRFCAGHRVAGHESKCARLHGHDYGVELYAQTSASKVGGRKTDNLGRVIDFSVLKERIGSWLDETWDHKTLLWERDDFALALVDADKPDPANEVLNRSIAWVQFNPTAENIALWLLEEVCPRLLKGTGVEVTTVVVHETPNCFAEVTR